MKIFKFGGASVKDAESVRNVVKVLGHYSNETILIVVSAMGKTTNALEKVVQAYLNKAENLADLVQEIEDKHFQIIKELFPSPEHRIYNDAGILFSQLKIITQGTSDGDFNKTYDAIVSFGELISTKIISAYLNQENYENYWLDARRLIRTDGNHRAARVLWDDTSSLINEAIKPGNRYITQGFIGSDENHQPTTLGREGSDYSASVLAYCLDAEEVIIWKDVPGVLNGDPKVFEDTSLLKQVSYREAIELAYYGASVIHPRTIQPLQKKNIPLRVKSFIDPTTMGTSISKGVDLEPVLPCFIEKKDQVLLTLSTNDLAFIAEDHLSLIYKLFHQFGVRINLSQNTAVSSSFCINNDPITTPKLIDELQKEFKLNYNEGVKLYTIRHYNEEAKETVHGNGTILLEQISRNTYQVALI